MNTIQTRLEHESGQIILNDKLVSFLYDLMRDHLPAADVQKLVENTTSKSTAYTNGYLAQYADFLATELRRVD